MHYISAEISLVALLPTLLLCWYIYEKDRVEKEPFSLLSLLFLAGGVGFIPSFFAQRGMMTLVDGWFASFLSFSPAGAVSFSSFGAQVGHAALTALCIALIENLAKWLILLLLTRKSRHFNCLFDGLIYACFASLGFAAFENVCYAWLNGWDTLLLRLITSVPYHLLIGTVMGYFYTVWHTVAVAQRQEKQLVAQGKLPAAKLHGAGWLLTSSLIAPVFTGCLYLLSGSLHYALVDILFYVAVGALFVLCFVGIRYLSDKDRPTSAASLVLILRKHPTIDPALLGEKEAGNEQ